METRVHTQSAHEIHSIKFGHGPKLMIAFHGYADRARIFAPIERVIAPYYTVIAIDLPFHGQTIWKDKSFTKEDILSIVQMYMQDEGVGRVSFLGFSFGARIVQSLLKECITYTDDIFLLAPDGIATRGLRAAIYTPMWVRKLIYYLVSRPGWFLAIMRLLTRLRLLNPLIWLFLEKNLSTPERYRRAFGMWFALDHFWLRRKEVNQLLNSHPVRVEIFFGRRDVYIKYKKVKKMAQKVKNVQLHMLNTGHRIIGPKLVEKLGDVLRNG